MGAVPTNCSIWLFMCLCIWQFADLKVQDLQIVGGNKVKITDAPFMALYLNRRWDVNTKCGASIIHERMLLSAAHCYESQGKSAVLVGADYYVPSEKPVRGKAYEIKEVISHPEYEYEEDGRNISNDICVIVVYKKVKFSDAVKPIPMARTNLVPEVSDLLTLYGFGNLVTGETTKDLHMVTLPYVERDNCSKLWGRQVPKNTICAGGEEGKGGCDGDSGGPVVYSGHLIGVLVAGSLDPCGQESYPMLITHVPSVRDFIDNVVNNNPDTQCAFKLLGGAPVKITDAPFVASFKLEDKRYTCAATIVHKQFLLATAHCLQEVALLNGDLNITVGSDSNNNGQNYAVEKIFIHPKFDVDSYDYDLSVIKLMDKLTLSDRVKTIELADAIRPIPGASVKVYGFGDNSQPSESLHMLDTLYYNWRECKNLYEPTEESPITYRMFCAGLLGRYNNCAGDKGGPAIYNNVLFGITSWGLETCHKLYPSIFTYLYPLKPYIEEIIKNNTN